MKPAVLVSGSNGGIGAAMVRSFKQANYITIGTDHHLEDRSKCDHYFQLNLLELAEPPSRAAALECLISFLDSRTHQLRCLVNNAAVQKLGSFCDLSDSDWDESYKINLLAPIFLAKGLLSRLEANQGSIINVGSIHSKLTKPTFVAYGVFKAAMDGFTRSLAVDLGGRVRVNSIMPAAIQTPMLVAGFERNLQALEELKQFHPSKLIGQPDEVGRLAVFLDSPACPFINGSVIEISGGIGSRLHDPH